MRGLVLLLGLVVCFVVDVDGVRFKNGRWRQVAGTNDVQFDWSGVSFEEDFLCPLDTYALHLTMVVSSSLASSVTTGTHFFLARLSGEVVGDRFSLGSIEANTPTSVSFWVPLGQTRRKDPNAPITVEMVKVTEALFGVVTLHSLNVATNSNCTLASSSSSSSSSHSSKKKVVEEVKKNPTLRLEFIGDSLTCGYGVLGTSPCSFTASTEDVTQAYAGLVVRNLSNTFFSSPSSSLSVDVQYSFISWSGKGVVRNYNGSGGPTMSQLWPLTLANDLQSQWDFSRFIPDIVVVFLGANDFSVPPQPSFASFSAGYNALFTQIENAYKKRNPFQKKLHIVATCGPFDVFCYQNYQEKVIQQRRDSQITFVSLNNTLPDSSYPGPYLGCDGHPNRDGAVYMQDKLMQSLIPIVHEILKK